MKTTLSIKLVTILVAVFLLSACGNPELIDRVDKSHADQSEQINKHLQKTKPVGQRPLIKKINGAWIAGKPVAVTKNEELPAIFGNTFKLTMMFPDKANLSTVAERITRITGLRVRINPDVFIPATDLNPEGSSTNSTENAAPTDNTTVSGSEGQDDFDTSMSLNYAKGSLRGLLDIVTARAGVSWKVKNNEIYLYRFMTKTFALKSIPGTADITASIGKTSSSSETGSGVETSGISNFSSSSEAKTNMNISAWAGVESAIRAMMTPLGKLSLSQATGTIVVTDVPDVIEQVESLVNHENRLLTRQVNLRIELLTVSLDEQDSFGVNWDAIYTNLSDIAGHSWNLAASGPVISVSENVGSMGFNILTSDSNNPTKFEGSSLMFKAINSVTRVVSKKVVSLTTTNNQPAPFALTNQTSYLAKIEAAAVTEGTTGSPGLTPGVVTTGFILNITPTILDNGKVLLHFTLDNSILDDIVTRTSGDNSIETPIVSAEQLLQRMVLKSNETVIIAPYESSRGTYEKRGIYKDAEVGYGGSYDGLESNTAIIVLVTPTLLEGA